MHDERIAIASDQGFSGLAFTPRVDARAGLRHRFRLADRVLEVIEAARMGKTLLRPETGYNSQPFRRAGIAIIVLVEL